jgi:hypothetical protein
MPPGRWCWTPTLSREKTLVNSNFRELLSVFNRFHVRYLVVGGYAVMRYTEPRYTKDLDVWVDPNPENIVQRFKALAEFGAPGMKEYSPDNFLKPYEWFQIGREPNRIDIITHIDAVRFSTAWGKRDTSRVVGITVHFISRRDLMRNKKAVGRSRDMEDLDNLKGLT